MNSYKYSPNIYIFTLDYITYNNQNQLYSKVNV